MFDWQTFINVVKSDRLKTKKISKALLFLFIKKKGKESRREDVFF